MFSHLLTFLRWEQDGERGFSAEGAVVMVSPGAFKKVLRKCLGGEWWQQKAVNLEVLLLRVLRIMCTKEHFYQWAALPRSFAE